jgi:hypothetical protein
MTTGLFKKLSLILCLLLLAPLAYSEMQAGDEKYVPHEYQWGKDVVWVPTEHKLAAKMLNLAKVTPQDYLIDLGSGDGRIVIAAAKRGATALGIEYNPDLVDLSIRNAIKEGVADKAKFVKADIFESDFSKATVITIFLLPELNLKLRPIILDMKPGVRVVSNSFNMGDWVADEKVFITEEEGCTEFFCEAFFWVVPAKAEGLWKLSDSDLILKQKYQTLAGEMKKVSNTKEIEGGLLKGAHISFTCDDILYTGIVEGNTIKGTFIKDGKEQQWHAKRVGDIPKEHRLK